MSKIDRLDGTSQDVLYAFDFKTFKRTAFIDCNNKLIHADFTGKPFEPLMCFPFYENVLNPDRKIEDIILNCQWIGPEKITMEIYPGLIKAMPHVDPETINFIVKGNKNKQGEPIYWPDIELILVYASVQEKFKPLIKNDKFFSAELEGANTEKTQEQEGEPGSTSIDKEYERMQRLHKEYIPPYQDKPLKKQPHPYEAPKTQEAPKKKTKAKILQLTKYPTPPQEIWDWCKEHYWAGEWKRILRALHRYSRYRKRNEDKFYPGKSKRKNRQYVLGQVWLAKQIGISRKTVEKWFQRFEDDGIIYYPYKGYRGRGASICELAYTEAHRRINKRKTEERKNPPSIR